MPSTGPSHATLFTSSYPLGHGVVANGYVLASEPAVLAEVLRSRGYRTGAVVSSYPLDRKFGYARGFEWYEQDFKEAESSIPRPRWEGKRLGQPYDRRAAAATRLAVDWLRQPRRAPFVLWVHYFDPHSPYDPPEPFRSRFAPAAAAAGIEREIAAYDGEIAFTDEEMGRLLDALDAAGLASRTLVVVAGDHGEGLLSHETKGHGQEVYEEAVRVPLVMRWKGRLLPAVVREPVELLDVAPTVLELVGAGRAPAGFRGTSLVGALRTGRAAPERPIFLQSEHQPGPRGYGVRAGRFKYIERRHKRELRRAELFDLETDPGERRDLLARHPEQAARLAGELREWSSRQGRPPAAPQLTEEDREALRALGYVQ